MPDQSELKLPHLTCLRCGHTWVPRQQVTHVCPNPKCHSPYWNTPRVLRGRKKK